MFGRLRAAFNSSKAEKRVRIEPLGKTVTIAAGQTLLQAALAAKVIYPHNCTVGTCGTCKSKLKQGSIRAISDFGYTLSKQELAAGYILACQSEPKDELTIVEIPDLGESAITPQKAEATITGTVPLTHDIWQMTLNLSKPIQYVAGQYLNVRMPGQTVARHYSFADAPQRLARQSVSFFIRKIPGGEFTEALFAGTLTDRTLEVDGPHGLFYLRTGVAPMVCVAGGSGLAPLISLLEDAHSRRVVRPAVLLFGARTEADLYLLDRIAALAQNWGAPFTFTPVLSHETAGSAWKGRRGMVTEYLGAQDIDFPWPQAQGYLCGPPAMVDSGITRLCELGLGLESIFYDKFTDQSAGSPVVANPVS